MSRETIIFKNKPKIIATYSIGGPKESTGPMADYIDKKLLDDKFNEKTFEKAECKMLSFAIGEVIKKAKLNQNQINAIVAGDLLNQIISSSYASRDYDIPYVGVYSACSTMSECIAIGGVLIDGGYMDNVICATGSHFATAERQYRYPLELGCTRPPQSQWTVTGAGSLILSNSNIKAPYLTSATFGQVVDYGVTDANNMGAAMAPACADTLIKHFNNTNTKPDDYDVIVSGDLGVLGSKLLKDLMWEKGYDLYNHVDCGEMIFNRCEDEFQGGSGAGCSAIVFNSYFIDKLSKGKYKKILFLATGALLSTVSTQQGESIPCVSHAVVVENENIK